jgi:hypothetical protein
MSDTHAMLKPKRIAVGTRLTHFFMLLAVLLSLVNCGDGNQVEVTLRGDAVEPPEPVDVMFSLNGREKSRTGVQPGELIELGTVEVGTVVRFQVANSRNAGQVRANILIDYCFRATTRCSEPGCIATAEYTAAVEECVN